MAQETDVFIVGKKYVFSVGDTFHMGTVSKLYGTTEIELKDVSILIPGNEILALLATGKTPTSTPTISRLVINRLIYITAIQV